jgi:hypothetical protein
MDLSKLSKKEKLELLDAIEAKKKKDREKRDIFKPHTGQLKALKSTAKEKFVFCGNGWGKSATAANWVIARARGKDPWQDKYIPTPNRTVVLLDSPSKIEDQWIPEMMKWVLIKPEWLKKDGKPYIRRIVWPTGSETIFMTHQQEPLIFESIELDYACLDEPPPQKIYNGLRRGMRKKGSNPELLLVGTPLTQAWLRKEVLDPWSKGTLENVEVFTGRTDENKENLNWESMEHYFSTLSDKEREIRQSGSFFDLEGLALAHLFNEETHLVEPFEIPNNWPVAISIDPHPSKKHTAVFLTSDGKDQLYAIKEVASKSSPNEFAKEIRQEMLGLNVIDIICDSLGATPTTGGDGNLSFIEVLNNQGVKARSTTFKEKSEEDFIQRIQQVLEIPMESDNFGRKQPKLKIFSNLKGLITDITNVEWLKHRNIDENKPKLNITDKDFLACLKYALTCNLSVRSTTPRRRNYTRKPSPWSAKRKK